MLHAHNLWALSPLHYAAPLCGNASGGELRGNRGPYHDSRSYADPDGEAVKVGY